MAILTDSFTDTDSTNLEDHTPDSGTGWTKAYSPGGVGWEINSNQARSEDGPNDGSQYTADGTYPSADYYIEFTKVSITGLGQPVLTVYLRYTDENNHYFLYCPGGLDWRIMKVVSGSESYLANWFSEPADGSVIRFEINGSDLAVYDDEVEIETATDTSITATGKAGIGAGENVNHAGYDSRTGIVIDDITVDAIGAAGAAPPPRIRPLRFWRK